MAIGGKRPTPNQQKQARGTDKPSRIAAVVDFPVTEQVPDCPEWVSYEKGRELWAEMAPILFSQRILTTADVHSLAHLCQLHGKMVDDYGRRLNPTAGELAQMRMYFSEFGMTPCSRARLSPGEQKKGGNKFAGNGRQAKA